MNYTRRQEAKYNMKKITCIMSRSLKLVPFESYCKQIARQLRTQYVEGIYDNPVTLKYRLTVTQGHWKLNH